MSNITFEIFKITEESIFNLSINSNRQRVSFILL